MWKIVIDCNEERTVDLWIFIGILTYESWTWINNAQVHWLSFVVVNFATFAFYYRGRSSIYDWQLSSRVSIKSEEKKARGKVPRAAVKCIRSV